MDITKKIFSLFPVVTENDVLFIILSAVVLILGFFLLIKGADIFVDGASKIAERLKVPLIVIGLTIVAFGTSAPEAAISITSAAKGTAGIAIGNVIGSNILNVMLILGITAIIKKLPANNNTFKYEIPFVFVISGVLLLLGILGSDINHIDGLVFVALFIIFMIYLFRIAKTDTTAHVVSENDIDEKAVPDSVPLMILFIILGLALIVVGSDMSVFGASNIAEKLGVSDRIIGLTIVAFGTSLPELVTSISAARKGKIDIAIGNIIGSNIFNILFVLGAAALVSAEPIVFSSQFIFDGIIAIASTALLWFLMLKNKTLTRSGGFILLLSYAAYFVYTVIPK